MIEVSKFNSNRSDELPKRVVSCLKKMGLDYQITNLKCYHLRKGKRGNKGSFWSRNYGQLHCILRDTHDVWRSKIRKAHPDSGGSHEEAAYLNKLWNRIKLLFARKGIVLLMILIARFAMADDVQIGWDASESPQASHYNVYSGVESGVYDIVYDASNALEFYVPDIFPGQNFFAVTALDDFGNESGFSNEVEYYADTLPPPGGVIITPAPTEVAVNWTTISGQAITHIATNSP